MQRFLHKTALCAALILAFSAHADPSYPPAKDDSFCLVPQSVWINAGDLSYHFNRNAGYREDNWGIGGQLNYADDLALLGGTFLNSDNRRSHDVGLLWQPLSLGPVKLGAVAGGFDGYPYMMHGAWFPAILPMASASYERIGANLSIVPNYKNRLHGAVVLQLMLRVW